MSSPRLFLALLLASSLSLGAATDAPPAPEKSSRGIWGSVVGGLKSAADGTVSVAKTASNAVGRVFDFSKPKRSGFKLEIIYGSNPIRLESSGTLPVKLQLFNTGKKTQLLEFFSAQRAEAVLRDPTGKIVSRASVSADSVAGLVPLNAGERMEFFLRLPTKELTTGKSYLLEAAITGHAGLVARVPVRIAS
jgi:hypothetical protein